MGRGNVFVSKKGHRDLELDTGTALLTSEGGSDGRSPLEVHGC